MYCYEGVVSSNWGIILLKDDQKQITV